MVKMPLPAVEVPLKVPRVPHASGAVAAVDGEGGIACGRGAGELYSAAGCALERGAIDGEGSPAPRCRAVREYYSKVAGSIIQPQSSVCPLNCSSCPCR